MWIKKLIKWSQLDLNRWEYNQNPLGYLWIQSCKPSPAANVTAPSNSACAIRSWALRSTSTLNALTSPFLHEVVQDRMRWVYPESKPHHGHWCQVMTYLSSLRLQFSHAFVTQWTSISSQKSQWLPRFSRGLIFPTCVLCSISSPRKHYFISGKLFLKK